MKAGAVLASHEGGVVGHKVVIGQGLINRGALALDLNDYGVAVSGEGSDHAQLNRAGRSNAYGQGIRGGELGCVVEILDSSCGEHARGASLGTHD